MKRIHYLCTLVALIMLSAPAAANSRPPLSEGQDLRITAVEGPRLVPTHLSYVWSAEGLKVQGRVAKSNDYRGRILGHVEVDLLDAQGAVVARHSGGLHRFSPHPKNPDWADFQVLIRVVPADVVAIRVAHGVGTRP